MSVREFRLAALSATMEAATLLEWKVAPGEEVSEGQPIAEVSTDKVDMDLEAPFTGTIVTLEAEAGAEVPLGGLLATIETEAEDLLGGLDFVTADTPARSEPVAPPSDEPSGQDVAGSGTVVAASPPARKMARAEGIDLATIQPTGRRGQVTPSDVAAAIADRAARAAEPSVQAEVPSTDRQPAPASGDDPRRAAIRRATADVMNRSAVIPQFTLYRTLDLERAAATRRGISWTTVLARALAGAVRSHPELNATWDEGERRATDADYVRVGIAVDRPGVGLVVATIDAPDVGDVERVDADIRSLIDRARTGKIRPEDLSPASVSLSNLGGLGVDRFNALLFPPQALILSIGSIRNRPTAAADGSLKATLTAEVGLTTDHRVGDGADAARFLETFAFLLQS